MGLAADAGDMVEDFALLWGKALDLGFVVGSYLIQQILQPAPHFDHFGLCDDAIEHQYQARVAVSEVLQRPQARAVCLEERVEIRTAFQIGSLAQQLLYLVKGQLVQVEDFEEVVEGLVVRTRFMEEGGRAADKHQRAVVHQDITELCVVPLIVDLAEDEIQVIHEQYEALVMLMAPILDAGEGGLLQIICVAELGFQLLRCLLQCRFGALLSQQTQNFEPEVSQVVDAIGLFRETHGLPARIEPPISHSKLHHQQHGRLAHAARRDKDGVLNPGPFRLALDQADQFVYDALTRNKGLLDLLFRHQIGIIKTLHRLASIARFHRIVSQPPIPQEFAGERILSRFRIVADVEIVLQVGHQRIEGFDVRLLAPLPFVELPTDIPAERPGHRQLAQEAFDGALLLGQIVVAQASVIVVEVGLAVHPQHLFAVDLFDLLRSDRFSVQAIGFVDLGKEDLNEVGYERSRQLQQFSTAGIRQRHLMRLRQFIHKLRSNLCRKRLQTQLLEVVDRRYLAQAVQNMPNPDGTRNQKPNFAEIRRQPQRPQPAQQRFRLLTVRLRASHTVNHHGKLIQDE